MEREVFSNEKIAELFNKKAINNASLSKKNTELKNDIMKSFLGWFSMCVLGASLNAVNSYAFEKEIPYWDIWNYQNINSFIGGFKWAILSLSNFFGDWIAIGKTYLWSIGDLLLLTSYLFLIISISKSLRKYFKNQ
jgi:hypothetical protein